MQPRSPFIAGRIKIPTLALNLSAVQRLVSHRRGPRPDIRRCDN
jgi:hypothetical protein